jgi:hypothetical protein
MPLHVSSICAHRQEVNIVLYSLWYRHTETSECSIITKITTINNNYYYVFILIELYFSNLVILVILDHSLVSV